MAGSIVFSGKKLNGKRDREIGVEIINAALKAAGSGIPEAKQKQIGMDGMWGRTLSVSYRSKAFRDALIEAGSNMGMEYRLV